MSKTTSRTLIVGLGDLGGKLFLQIATQDKTVQGIDIVPRDKPKEAVDPKLRIDQLAWPLHTDHTLDALLPTADIIHWCAPLDALTTIDAWPESAILVLHSSTMSSSISALQDLEKRLSRPVRAAIVHCLMNPTCTVVVAKDIGKSKEVSQHLTAIGLSPIQMKSTDHDSLMAQSQGIFALLINMGLRAKLHDWDAQGLLVPSAHELKAALENREANWTKVTIDTILSNPKLAEFAAEISQALQKTNQPGDTIE